MLSISPRTTAACGSQHLPGVPRSRCHFYCLPTADGTLGEDSAAHTEGRQPLVLQPGLCLCFCSLPLNQIYIFFLNFTVLSGKRSFLPHALFLSMYVFPSPFRFVVSPRLSVAFSVCAHCRFIWNFPSLQPPRLLSFLSAVFWFLSQLFLLSMTSLCSLGRVACCLPGGARVGSRRALSCTGGGEKTG